MARAAVFRRAPWTWALVSLCIMLVAAAMSWISLTMLGLERDSAATRARAELEEDTRLALWRMDALVTQILGREGSRPFFVFRSFYPAERTYPEMLETLEADERLAASPLLPEPPSPVRLHFQLEPDDRLTSPQVPEPGLRTLAEDEVPAELIEQRTSLLEDLERLVKPESLREALSEMLPEEPSPAETLPEETLPEPIRRPAPVPIERETEASQQLLNLQEFQARAANVQNVFIIEPQDRKALRPPSLEPPLEGPLQPLWIGDELLLARRVTTTGGAYIQGCWLDWPDLEQQLLEAVTDILPEARLVPEHRPGDDEALGRRLASLPLALDPGPAPMPRITGVSPVGASLLTAWACLAVAAAAVIILLRAAISLSERRAAFVSAVTHELRTPLTTLRIYTEMLADGMISDPATRQEYLESLHNQSSRLAHLVENVLAYSRLERGNQGAVREPAAVVELIDRVAPHLEERAHQAGLDLEITIDPQAVDAQVMVDRAAVERILMNLVDNAAKHGASGRSPAIEMRVEARGAEIVISVRDHGPGVPAELLSTLFTPFSRSADEAAASAPGVGLGLALSRRLAREMGGELRLDRSTTDGACLELRLLCPREET